MHRSDNTARWRARPRLHDGEAHDLGSIRGFAQMHRACYRYVWVVLANLGVPEAQLDDAHQEVFVTCYRRRESYQSDRPIKPWLVGVARRIAFRYRRSEQRVRRKHGEYTRERGGPRSDLRGQAEARILLDQVLDRLDPQQREVLILSELEGRTGPEIADALGIHLDAAYSRLRAARRALTRAFTTIDAEPLPQAQARQAFAALLPQLGPASTSLPWIGAWGLKAKVAAAIVVVAAIGAAAAPLVDPFGPSPTTGAVAAATRAASGGGSAALAIGDDADDADGDDADEASDPAPPLDPSPFAAVARAADRGRSRLRSPADPGESATSEAAADAGASSLGEEARLLAQAKRALNDGAPADALAALDEHARRFRGGSLAEAREGLRIAALCALDRRREARGAAAALRRDHPGSSLAWRLADPCPLAPPASDAGR